MPKVVESESHVEELTVDHGKRALVTNAFDRIRLLFNVLVAFSSPEESASKTGIQWLALKGEKDKITKAKEYIKSLCNPEINISVPFSEELYAVIYPFRDELERSTGAVVNFPSSSECTVQGSQEAVIMAQSVIEDKLCNINTSSRTSARRDIDPSLREFALKLGYSKQVIDQAVRKLGPDATQNTLLSELLKTTASMPYQLSAPQPKPMPAPAAPYPRRDARDIIPRGAPTAQPVMARAGYDNPADIYTERGTAHAGMPHRRDIRDSSGQPPMFRSGYENPRDAIPNGSQPAMVRPGYDTPSDVLERGASRGTKRVYERSGDIAVRGSSSAMRPPMQGPGYGAHVQPTHDAYHVAAGSGVNDRGLPDRQEEQFVYQQLQDVKETLGDAASSDLRPVVVDGSNVAMSHGRQEYFSCKGIQLCVDYFRKRGHKEITVFVPLWRKEASRPEKPITDQDILYNLERERVLVFTPSRKVNGRRIVCYDDRFIIKLAAETDGVVVSMDNFRDLTKESPKWRDTIEQRLLMYSFVGDMFMIPDDPLGKHGPNLDEFLRKGSTTHPRICPYLKKCTYGLKCRFYHPERDQERAESSRKLQELRGIFGESVSDAVMIRVVNENPGANVTLLANRLCDMGHGLGGKH